MEINLKAWVRFVRVKLQNFKMFDDSSEITFSKDKTVIAGPGGSGKTQIYNLLESLSSKVEVEGNLELLRKYGRFIFINSENATPSSGKDPCASIACGGHRFSHEVSTGAIFAEMTGAGFKKAWGTDIAMLIFGEQRCMWYASVFAALEVLKINFPVVIDSPFAMLDNDLRQGVSAFFKKQSGQIILLGVESEFVGLEKPDYVLETVGSTVRVRKIKTDK
jgi:energy-coupling factor transporter ATP-binding protein EcfA2